MTEHTQKPFRVLWIEDELQVEVVKLFSDKLQDELKGRMIDITEAPHLESADELLQKMRSDPPDLIVLDIMLPRHKTAAIASPPRVDENAGWLIWYGLRNLKEWGDGMVSIPIVVLTARGNPEFRPVMEDDANLLWLSKPMSGDEVGVEVLQWLSNRAQAKQEV